MSTTSRSVAWASTEAKARSFGPPDAVNDGLELDFRVGGIETISGGPPPVHVYEATYKDIVADERIVYGYTMQVDGTLISVSVTTVEFAGTSSGDGTTLTFSEQGVFLDGSDTPAVRQKGTSELLDQLGTALA